MRIIKSVIVLLLFLQCVASEAGTVPLLSVNPAEDASSVEPANNKTWGYLFEVKIPITVTHLAWNDTDLDGLSHSHLVGIWKDTDGSGQLGPLYELPNTLLTWATIPAGTAAELSGPWRRISITPLKLLPGLYSIGGQNSSQSTDDMIFIGELPLSVIDPRVEILSFDFNVGGPDGFHPPGSPPSGWYLEPGVEVGPMMFVEAIPEPASAALLIAGLVMFAARKRAWNRTR
jgi:hypothetical protein